MTGAEVTWMRSNHPKSLLELLENDLFAGRIDRKWRLYLCACARQFGFQLSDFDLIAIDAAEELADSERPSQEISWTSFGCSAVQAGSSLMQKHRHEAYGDSIEQPTTDERRVKAALLKDIFGNPFHPVEIDPRWRSSTVIDLARTIYEESVWERMPILADALMDAGCDSEDILSHCHHKGPHVRGCWVVDLLLGKR